MTVATSGVRMWFLNSVHFVNYGQITH